MRKVLIVAMAVALVGFLGQGQAAFADPFNVTHRITSSPGSVSSASSGPNSVTYTITTTALETMYGYGSNSGGDYYTWGIPSSIFTPGMNLLSASLTFYNLHTTEWYNNLYVDLLGGPNTGVYYGQDTNWNSTNGYGDTYNQFDLYGNATQVTDFYGSTHYQTGNFYSYNWYTLDLNPYLTTLADYIKSGTFGLGFDPDCTWYNSGIKLTIIVDPTPTTPTPTPEPMTLLLFGTGLVGLGGFQIRKRKKS